MQNGPFENNILLLDLIENDLFITLILQLVIVELLFIYLYISNIT